VCPDAAIPNTVHELPDLMLAAVKLIDLSEEQREAVRSHIPALDDAVRKAYRKVKGHKPFHEMAAAAVNELKLGDPTLKRNVDMMVAALARYPVVKTRPFFDAMEKAAPGSGGLYSVNIDPWKCTGCLECLDVCGPKALVERQQDAALLETMQERFEFLTLMPNTAERFFEDAKAPFKRLILDHKKYYAMTGGHGACRGCGEVTAIRLVTAASHAIHDKRRADHIHQVGNLINALAAKLVTTKDTDGDPGRRERIRNAIAVLEKRLYHLESGPTGNGPASTVFANATGCSSVFASTFPFNPYTDPWVNSLFQDAPALAKGIFEGLAAAAIDDIRALRIAGLDLDDDYDPPVHDKLFRTFSWADFTPEELALLPTVISMGGDGATYDIGFGALSRLLSTTTPIKVVVLNTGAYSNTGGQASTASLTGQDSDLARFGAAHSGKQDQRKELGLIAAFHPNVFVVQTSTALQGHFWASVMRYLSHTDSPAVLDLYTPCQGEQGIADSAAREHARMAIESRMNPVFVHDPNRGTDLHARFSIEGNSDADKDWKSTSIDYVEDGVMKKIDVPFTPADFAATETRFKKQFRRFDAAADGVLVHEYIDLDPAARVGKTPFIYTTDDDKKLIKLEVSQTLVRLVQDRRKYWRTLQYLGGIHLAGIDERHRADLEALQGQLKDATQRREEVITSIVDTVSNLSG
jgi:pyruvate-ferredoxin/flavodoxin oxidoreductase